jgi:hypothetical protein
MKSDKRNNNSKKKHEMFVSQDEITARSKHKILRAEILAKCQDDDSDSLYFKRDERRSNMNGGAPVVKNSRYDKQAPQSPYWGNRKSPFISCGDNLYAHQEQYDFSCSDGC